MALEAKYNILFTKDCGTKKFGDDTGDYDAETNAGGFGTPNEERTDITKTIITMTNKNGDEFIYEDYLPTTEEIELTPDMFTPPISVIVSSSDDDCGCTPCSDSEVESTTETSVYPDGCWTLKYELYVDDDVVATRVEDIFFDCNTMVRWIANMTGTVCNDCDQEIQDALREASQEHDEALLVYKHAGCDCAEKKLLKANNILSDIENGVIN